MCSSHLTRIPGSKWIGPDPSLVGVHVPQDLADGGRVVRAALAVAETGVGSLS